MLLLDQQLDSVLLRLASTLHSLLVSLHPAAAGGGSGSRSAEEDPQRGARRITLSRALLIYFSGGARQSFAIVFRVRMEREAMRDE